MTRPSLSLALALALPQVQDTSFLHGIDLASQSVLRSETGAYLGGLTTLGSTGAMVEALDFDAAGRDLWAVARDGAGVDVGTLDLGTGAFTRRGGAPIVGAVTDLASAPDGRTWYVAERSGGDAVVWRGELPNADLQPWVTLAGSGPLAGLSVTDTGRVVACEGASGVLVELDAVSGARTVLSTLNTNGDLPLGMDFDWATGELFAVLGPTSPRFATIHLATGAAATVADLASIQAP
ncbi:MAG: hypothetical protein R3F49_11265 [Planctomycetota bacterium]